MSVGSRLGMAKDIRRFGAKGTSHGNAQAGKGCPEHPVEDMSLLSRGGGSLEICPDVHGDSQSETLGHPPAFAIGERIALQLCKPFVLCAAKHIVHSLPAPHILGRTPAGHGKRLEKKLAGNVSLPLL